MKIQYIVFIAKVEQNTIGRLRNAITNTINNGYEELYFLISSTGGDVNEGLNLSAFIKALPVKTTMHNIGQIDSVANVIFSSAQERYAKENSSFLFHGISMGYEKVRFNESQLYEQYQISKRFGEDIARNVSSYSGICFERIKTFMTPPVKILNAQEAKKEGLIHNIKDIRIPKGFKIISIGNV